MNYDKKISKLFSLLSSESYIHRINPDSVTPDYTCSFGPLKTTFALSALASAYTDFYLSTGQSCKWLSFSAERAVYHSQIENNYPFLKATTGDRLVGFNFRLNGYIDYLKITNDDKFLNKYTKTAEDVVFSNYSQLLTDDVVSENTGVFYQKASLLFSLSKLINKSKNSDDIIKTTEKIAQTILLTQKPQDNVFYIILTAIGLLYASNTCEHALNAAEDLAYFLIKRNNNLNYSFSNDMNDTANPATTALAFKFFTELYLKTSNTKYRYYARRIWFNAMQFCQRENGEVGIDYAPKRENGGILKIKEYDVPCLLPVYALGICTYVKNKKLFEEEESEVKKDLTGRYVIGDKIFAKDESGFFGKDLIEIPSLTSFDKQTALQLKLRLLF